MLLCRQQFEAFDWPSFCADVLLLWVVVGAGDKDSRHPIRRDCADTLRLARETARHTPLSSFFIS